VMFLLLDSQNITTIFARICRYPNTPARISLILARKCLFLVVFNIFTFVDSTESRGNELSIFTNAPEYDL
jgi:hypothetical protein